MRIYGIIGESKVYYEQAPSGPSVVPMQTDRPTPAHVAGADGQWIIPPGSPDNVRAERNERITAIRWRIERYHDELAMGTPVEERTEDIEPVLLYVQALRDIPEQEGFPENIEWPVEPLLT